MTTRVPESRRLGVHRSWLAHLVAIVATVLAFLFAPTVDQWHPASDLSPFYSAGATVSAALLVAMALFSGPLGGMIAWKVLRWITPLSFVYVGISTAAFLLGSVSTLADGAYRFLFAFSMGPGAVGLVTVLLMGWANIGGQRDAAAPARAEELGTPAREPEDGSRGA